MLLIFYERIQNLVLLNTVISKYNSVKDYKLNADVYIDVQIIELRMPI